MKNKLWFSALIVSLCAVSFIFIYGCGSPTSGGSGGGGGTTYSGRIVDPLIAGCTIFVDIDGDGVLDPLVTAEMIATSDANGYFSFTEAPSMGATIRVLFQGLHLGITYDAQLLRQVDGIGNLNITPYTTLLANNISAESIKYILEHYAGITIDASMLRDDPLSGIDLSSIASINQLRGAICTYCLIQVISTETGVYGGYFDLASIESGPNSTDIKAGLVQMGLAVRSALSDDFVDMLNMGIASIEMDTNARLNPFGMTANIPPATIDDVASTAFVITRWVMEHALANAPIYNPGVTCINSIEPFAGRVGMREYLLRNREHVVFTVPSIGGPYPIPSGPYDFETMVDNAWMEDQVGVIPTGEVASTVKGYKLLYLDYTNIYKVN